MNNPPPGFPAPGGRKFPLKIDSLPVSWILIQQVDLTTDVKKITFVTVLIFF